MRGRKIAKNDYYLPHVRPSVRIEQFGTHWTDFHEVWQLSIFFFKSDKKIEVSLKWGSSYPKSDRGTQLVNHARVSFGGGN